MSAPLTFYTHPMSRARITRWMLEETGLPYREVVLDYGTTMKSADYLQINPLGQVPAIQHGDTVVTENAAICAYLANLVPGKRLAPPVDSPERGPYYRWLFFLAGPLESLLTAKQAGMWVAPKTAGYGCLADLLHTLEQTVVGRDYVVGDHFTTADLLMAAYLNFYTRIGALERSPVFDAYVDRHVSRPASIAANAHDDMLALSHPLPGG